MTTQNCNNNVTIGGTVGLRYVGHGSCRSVRSRKPHSVVIANMVKVSRDYRRSARRFTV